MKLDTFCRIFDKETGLYAKNRIYALGSPGFIAWWSKGGHVWTSEESMQRFIRMSVGVAEALRGGVLDRVEVVIGDEHVGIVEYVAQRLWILKGKE